MATRALAAVDRPTTYSEELGRRVCDVVATAKGGLRETLDKGEGLPTIDNVMWWLRNNAHFAQQYADAKNTQLRLMAEDIVDISQDESLDPNDKRVRIDTRKWLLSKLIPKTYGDKLDVTSGGEALAAPSHQIDARIQSIVMQAQQRALKLSDEAKNLLE